MSKRSRRGSRRHGQRAEQPQVQQPQQQAGGTGTGGAASTPSAEPARAAAGGGGEGGGRAARKARAAARRAGTAAQRRRFQLPSATPWFVGGAAILGVVIIIGVLSVSGGGSGGAQVGDHWHAPLTINVCGQNYIEPQENPLPGLHTHGDSVLHIEPRNASEAGGNASLRTYFKNNLMKIGPDFVQLPGDPVLRNGDPCPDGKAGTLRVLINGQQTQDFLDYLPHDGDRIQVLYN